MTEHRKNFAYSTPLIQLDAGEFTTVDIPVDYAFTASKIVRDSDGLFDYMVMDSTGPWFNLPLSSQSGTGSAALPFNLPIPAKIDADSKITVSIKNTDTKVIKVRLTLHGFYTYTTMDAQEKIDSCYLRDYQDDAADWWKP